MGAAALARARAPCSGASIATASAMQSTFGKLNVSLLAGKGIRSMSSGHKIVYTLTDEAPMLATYAFLPIIKRFTDPYGIAVEKSDISVAARVLSHFGDRLKPEQRVPDNLSSLVNCARHRQQTSSNCLMSAPRFRSLLSASLSFRPRGMIFLTTYRTRRMRKRRKSKHVSQKFSAALSTQFSVKETRIAV